MVLMTYHKSKMAADYHALVSRGILTYLFDPVNRKFNEMPAMRNFNHVIVVQALEYLPTMMEKANLLKEALVCLRTDRKLPMVLAITRSRESIEKIAEEKKWKKEGDRYITPLKNQDGGKMSILGINEEELIILFRFAGAASVWVPDDLKDEDFGFVAASIYEK